MIITRTPLRISIGGGGTDLPSYYSRFGGFVISVTINKYIYITLHQTFLQKRPPEIFGNGKSGRDRTISSTRSSAKPLRCTTWNPIYRNGEHGRSFPQATGLAFSGSFTVGLLRAIWTSMETPAGHAASHRGRSLPYRDGSFETADRQTRSIHLFLWRDDVHDV